MNSKWFLIFIKNWRATIIAGGIYFVVVVSSSGCERPFSAFNFHMNNSMKVSHLNLLDGKIQSRAHFGCKWKMNINASLDSATQFHTATTAISCELYRWEANLRCVEHNYNNIVEETLERATGCPISTTAINKSANNFRFAGVNDDDDDDIVVEQICI